MAMGEMQLDLLQDERKDRSVFFILSHLDYEDDVQWVLAVGEAMLQEGWKVFFITSKGYSSHRLVRKGFREVQLPFCTERFYFTPKGVQVFEDTDREREAGSYTFLWL